MTPLFNNHPYREKGRHPLDALLHQRILVLDGAIGTMLPDRPPDVLNLTHPQIVKDIHQQFLDAGADLIQTNTFNSQTYDLNLAGAKIARSAVDQHRFVIGTVGPTSQTAEAYYERTRGLMDGGVDLLMLETVCDTNNAQIALSAFERCFLESGRRVPVMLSVTIDKTGRTLSGQSLEAFWHSISEANLFSIGINCGFGANNMKPYVEELSRLAGIYTSCHPNAGLPNASGGYDETPSDTSSVLRECAANGWVNIVGGCCGTTPEHIRALAASVRGLKPRKI